jgi:hypothetical protein
MSGDVRPEFDEFRADDAFCGNRERPVYCLPKAPIRSRIVNIGNAPGDEVAQHIRVVWSPCATVALTPNSGGCGVEKAMGEGTRAKTKVARIFLEDDGEDSVAPEISVCGVEVRRTKALEVALGSLPESWIGIARLTETGNKRVCDKHEWIDRAFIHQVELLSRRETRHTSRALDSVEVWHHA